MHVIFSGAVVFMERNPNETFQRLEEPLCNNLIVLCKKHHLINKMRLKYSCSDLFTLKILIQTVKNYIYSHEKFNEKLDPNVSCTTL